MQEVSSIMGKVVDYPLYFRPRWLSGRSILLRRGMVSWGIIILYICTPLLLWIHKHMKILGSVALGVAYYVVIFKDYFGVIGFHNILICAISFWIGMLLEGHIDKIISNWILEAVNFSMFMEEKSFR